MIENIQNPAIAYTASRLRDYAQTHGIDADKPFVPVPDTLGSDSDAGRSLRLGYAIPPLFEVAESVPRTIPIVLARLAIFDSRLSMPESAWEFDRNFGVHNDSVSWLRLVQVSPSDKKVDEILSIVGAKYENGVKGRERDQRGNRVRYTKHYYLESDQYAVKVAQCAPDQHLGLPVTSIGFSLPDRSVRNAS